MIYPSNLPVYLLCTPISILPVITGRDRVQGRDVGRLKPRLDRYMTSGEGGKSKKLGAEGSPIYVNNGRAPKLT